MSNELTVQHTPEQLKLITSTVAKNATPDELKLFLYRANNLGLDPLKPGQIHFVKYGNGSGTIVVGIDGLRSKAARTGKLAGIKRGALRDNNKLVGGWAEVYRTDWKEPAREEVPLSEYTTGKGPWSKMPETMIKKVAEAAALRMAFPDEFGGVYVQEEMAQAETQVRDSAPKALAQDEVTSVINQFVTVCEQSQDSHGRDFYKKYLRNSKGESPSFDQVLKWKSEAQINWLKSATQAMISAMSSDELPAFDADVEVFDVA